MIKYYFLAGALALIALQAYYSNIQKAEIKALKQEKFDFIGFFNSRLIKCEDKIYNLGFGLNYAQTVFENDFLFIVYCGIYQKLNELN